MVILSKIKRAKLYVWTALLILPALLLAALFAWIGLDVWMWIFTGIAMVLVVFTAFTIGLGSLRNYLKLIKK